MSNVLKDVIAQLAYIEASLNGIIESMTYLQEECATLAQEMHSQEANHKVRAVKYNQIKLLEVLFEPAPKEAKDLELPVKGSMGPVSKGCKHCENGCCKCQKSSM